MVVCSDVGPVAAGRVANGLEVEFETPSGVVFLLRNTRKGTRLFAPAGPEVGTFPDEVFAKCAAVALSRCDLFLDAMRCASLADMERCIRPLLDEDSPLCGE